MLSLAFVFCWWATAPGRAGAAARLAAGRARKATPISAVLSGLLLNVALLRSEGCVAKVLVDGASAPICNNLA